MSVILGPSLTGPIQRVLRGASATVGTTFQVDGVDIDPGTASVSITRSDGTTLVEDAVPNEGTPGAFTYELTPVETALLDTLTFHWTATISGQVQTLGQIVEIVGGYYFSIAEARSLEGLAVTSYTNAEVANARTLVEQSIDDAFGVAFVPRYTRETIDGAGGVTMMLRWPMINSIRSVTIDGTAGTAALVAFQPTGRAYYAAGWTAGFSNIVLGYEHGHPYPPERLRRGAVRLARRWLVDGPVDDRRTFEATDAGTFGLLTPGRGGALFDIPELEALRAIYAQTVTVA